MHISDVMKDLHRVWPDASFWKDRRVLLTGHTGFKGAWLAFWLTRMGAKVTGLALQAQTRPNLFEILSIEKHLSSHIGDIRSLDVIQNVVDICKPEIVLHLAAQALVRTSYKNPLNTFETNVLGSLNLLEVLRGNKNVKVIVMVTTDKVYRNLEQREPYSEFAELGGHDPYSASKAASELLIASYRSSYFNEQGVAVIAARAGNVIGGGDWAEDRLLPDAVRAWQRKQILQIRRPDAIRPWQHVLEPLAAYMCLAQQAYFHPDIDTAWNIGPEGTATVREVVELARISYGQGDVEFAANLAGPHEAGLLMLDVRKLKKELGIQPRWQLEEAVHRSLDWYRQFEAGTSGSSLCTEDIDAFLS
ncbi:CDP-glucose 4,6-dehydratase [Undibacterium sp. TJN19]|uniref:CDP-glucose 4,6-dehydratase n=1 Tax=Undibacterium sp. TJN19 TaxID=3413055 RepID=UPI003BF29D0C